MSPEWRDRLRDRSNPKLDHGVDFLKCYECGKIIAPSEVVDSKYCTSCAEIFRKVEKGYKKCLGCDDYFPPNELYQGKYCSKCKEKLVRCDLCSSKFFRGNDRVVCLTCFGKMPENVLSVDTFSYLKKNTTSFASIVSRNKNHLQKIKNLC